MHFLRRKYIIVTISVIIFFIAGAYLQYTNPPWLAAIEKQLASNTLWRKTPVLQQIDISKYKNVNIPQEQKFMQQKTFSYNVYTGMHMRFTYPGEIQLMQTNPNLISLANSTEKDKSKGLLIYSTHVITDTNNLQLPFPLSGKMQSITTVPMQNFDARQVIYTDGKNETVLLMLLQNHQVIVFRMPEDAKSIDSNAINEIINSLTLTN